MDDEKKMTLDAEEEKQFHSRFSFFRSPVPSSPVLRHRSLPPIFFFSCDIRRPGTTLAIRHERERGQGTRLARGPHGVVTIVIYISFLFVSMTTSLRLHGSEEANEKRLKDRILCASHFRSSRYNIESF